MTIRVNKSVKDGLSSVLDLIQRSPGKTLPGKKKGRKPTRGKKRKRRKAGMGGVSASDRTAFRQGQRQVMEEYGELFNQTGLHGYADIVLQMDIQRFRGIFPGMHFRASVVRDLFLFIFYSSPVIHMDRSLNGFTRAMMPHTLSTTSLHTANASSATSPFNKIVYGMMSAYFNTLGERRLGRGVQEYYRGDSHDRNVAVEQMFAVESFWSSSERRDIAEIFAGPGIVYHITDTAQVMPFPVGNISEIRDERECLFPPGTLFRVTRIQGQTVHVETVGLILELLEPTLKRYYSQLMTRDRLQNRCVLQFDDALPIVNRRPEPNQPVFLPVGPVGPDPIYVRTWGETALLVATSVATLGFWGVMAVMDNPLGIGMAGSTKTSKTHKKTRSRKGVSRKRKTTR